MDIVKSYSLGDGKYEIQKSDDGKMFKALRYGQEWRDLLGNKLILSLIHKIEELEDERLCLYNEIAILKMKD